MALQQHWSAFIFLPMLNHKLLSLINEVRYQLRVSDLKSFKVLPYTSNRFCEYQHYNSSTLWIRKRYRRISALIYKPQSPLHGKSRMERTLRKKKRELMKIQLKGLKSCTVWTVLHRWLHTKESGWTDPKWLNTVASCYLYLQHYKRKYPSVAYFGRCWYFKTFIIKTAAERQKKKGNSENSH